MEEVLPSTSTEVESEDISEYEPEPVEKISKPLNVSTKDMYQQPKSNVSTFLDRSWCSKTTFLA